MHSTMYQTNYGYLKNIATLQTGARILFANMPADGHFNPLTGLAYHLKALGHDVRWYTSPHYKSKIEALGIPFFPFKKTIDFNGDNVTEIFAEREKLKSQVAKLKFDLINVFILRSEEYYEDLKDIHEEFPFDVLVCDVAFTAIPFVKDKMNIPVISIGIFPLMETSKDLAPNGLGITPSYTFWGRKKQALLRFVADNVLFKKPNQVMQLLLKKHGIEAGNTNVFDLAVRKSTLMLQSGAPGFEYKRSDLGKNIRFIGALLPHQKIKKETWFDDRLLNYKKIVLVTQGTVEKDVNNILVPTLEAFKGTDTLVVATTGGSDTALLRSKYAAPNIIIEDFIPFADVMPYAHVYVTNGGYGGVMLSIQNKLPMVVAGVHEGKNEICARVGYFNLGINLKTETPTAAQLKQAVERVIADENYYEQVKKLAREFSKYDPQELCAAYVEEVLLLSRPKVYRSRMEVSSEI
jgi:MGT family glycosyltransferase